MMNTHYYNFGNPFKVKFRKHYCYICGSKLSIIKHRITIDQKSEEAKYYDFSVGVDGGVMIGPCRFVHNVFYCKQCQQNIEFITQINQEDIDNLINCVRKKYKKHGQIISIKKCFEKNDGEIVERCKLEFVNNLCLFVKEGKKTCIYRIPISRKSSWERPHFFKLKMKDLINFIKQSKNTDDSFSIDQE